MTYRNHEVKEIGRVGATSAAPLVYTRKDAPAPSDGHFRASQSLTLQEIQDFFEQPQTVYLENGHLTVIDSETAEVSTTKPTDNRAERWALKSAVNELLPNSRTSKCHKWVVPNNKPTVYRTIDQQKGKAFFGGLQVCANVWACPVCAAKISERRRDELSFAIQQAKIQGLHVSMLTLTIPHKLVDDLNALLDSLLAAHTKLWKDKAGKRLIESYKIEGRIRALEVTFGDNGYHPHLHILLFSSSPIQVDKFSLDVFHVWKHCCVSKGLGEPSLKHGVKVDIADEHIGSYVAKWGLDSEMTKGHVKRSKVGYSMTDLLRAYIATGEERFSRLWLVYAKSFKGRRQLVWTKGLKDRLLVLDATDEDLATAQVAEAEMFAELSFEQWRAVYRTKSEYYVLKAAESNPETFDSLLDGIVRLYEQMEDDSSRRRGKGCGSAAHSRASCSNN